jgi:asparagine synthase (glutamine-hydrolysing)
MCGFIGCFSKNPLGQNFSIKKYLEIIGYRGPDSQNIYENENKTFVVGFNRLSIIDLSSNANQPFENGKFISSSNCEIYNFKEIKKQLNEFEFKSETDAEVFIGGFQKWGDELFEKLEGMFSVNIYDKSHKITLARDRFGIKPLFYFLDDDKLFFSSEFYSLYKLVKNFKNNLEINNESLENFLFGPFNFSSNSLIKNIKKLEPGNLMTVNRDFKVIKKKYWETAFTEEHMSFEQAKEKFDDLINASIEKHLISDVPIATMYSGGIDSSLITKLASMKNQNITSITANFDNQFTNTELKNIKEFNSSIGVKNHIFDINTKNIIKNIDEDIMIYDDLSSSDPGFLTNFKIANKIKKLGFKVVLVGDGADEMISGYSWFGLDKYPFKLFPEHIKDLLYFYSISRTFDLENGYKVFKRFKNKLINNLDYGKKISLNELFIQLPNNYLTKVDRATMHNSIEARVPYLDNQIFNLSINLNSKYKLKGDYYFLNSFRKSNEKYIMREVSKKYLPDYISLKKKYGYSFDISKVIRDNIEIFSEIHLKNNSKIQDYFHINKVKKMFKGLNNKKYSPLSTYNNIILWKFFL